jgi:hypothetical protein
MSDSRPTGEISALRWNVARMEAGELLIRVNCQDATQREIAILKREIAFLVKIAAWRVEDDGH